MRTYGRVTNPDGSKSWVQVNPAPNGDNDYIYLTTLIQTLKLNLGESPFYSNYGIPAAQSVMSQILPTYYTLQTQTQFSPFFSSLIISLLQSNPPIYMVNVVLNSGVPLEVQVPV